LNESNSLRKTKFKRYDKLDSLIKKIEYLKNTKDNNDTMLSYFTNEIDRINKLTKTLDDFKTNFLGEYFKYPVLLTDVDSNSIIDSIMIYSVRNKTRKESGISTYGSMMDSNLYAFYNEFNVSNYNQGFVLNPNNKYSKDGKINSGLYYEHDGYKTTVSQKNKLVYEVLMENSKNEYLNSNPIPTINIENYFRKKGYKNIIRVDTNLFLKNKSTKQIGSYLQYYRKNILKLFDSSSSAICLIPNLISLLPISFALQVE
jgi:hypothetical protein